MNYHKCIPHHLGTHAYLLCCCCSVDKSCLTLCDSVDCSPPGSSPGKNTGVGCHFLLKGIFPDQGLNLRLLHWQVDSSLLNHLGSLVTFGKEAGIIQGALGDRREVPTIPDSTVVSMELGLESSCLISGSLEPFSFKSVLPSILYQ